jgi:hypothetical protein
MPTPAKSQAAQTAMGCKAKIYAKGQKKNVIAMSSNPNATIDAVTWFKDETDMIIYPELEATNPYHYNKTIDLNGVGIAISGGGSRSFTATIGYVRGLVDITIHSNKNAFNAAQYVSSVSGGSWFTGTYLLAKNMNKLTDNQLLGTFRSPDNITLANLLTDNDANNDSKNPYPLTLCSRATHQDAISNLTSLIGKVSTQHLWNYTVGKIFLEPYGLNKRPLAINAYQSSVMYNANTKVLGNKLQRPIYPAIEDPFWIANTTLLQSSLKLQGTTDVQITPMYCGHPQIISGSNITVGGVLTDAMGFSCFCPDSSQIDTAKANKSIGRKYTIMKVQLSPILNGTLCVDDIIGTSSAAFAGEVAKYTSISNIDPQYNYWCPSVKNVTQTLIPTGDGAFCDNLGVIALLSRGIKKIICFDNTGVLLGSNSISGYPNSYASGVCLLNLFGLEHSVPISAQSADNDPLFNLDSTQVFESSAWSSFQAQLKSTTTAGGPTYARATLKVLPNKRNCITGGYQVDFFVIVLQPSSTFNNALPSNIRSEFGGNISELGHFPLYKTMFENFANVIQYTPRQVNLLASYTHWTIQQPAITNIIKDMYA